MKAFDLRDELASKTGGAKRPDDPQCNRPASDHERWSISEWAYVQGRVHAYRERLDERSGAIRKRVVHDEELALVRNHALAPAAGEAVVVADRHARLKSLARDAKLALVAHARAGAVLTARAGLALGVAWKAAHRARDHRVDGNALAWLDAANGWAHLRDARENLVTQDGRKRAKGFQDRARFERQCADVRAANAGLEHFEPHPVVAWKRWLLDIPVADAAEAAEDRGLGDAPRPLPIRKLGMVISNVTACISTCLSFPSRQRM